MKRLLSFIMVVAFIIQMPACKKQLDVLPVDQFSDASVWNDAALIQTFVNNIYSGVPHGFGCIMLASMADESMYNADFGSSNVTKSNINPSDFAIFDPNFWASNLKQYSWDTEYKYIRATNVFFSKIDAAPVEATVKDAMKGEAHFLRAYIYSNLVSIYGAIPIITKAYGLSDSFAVPRNTYEENIKFITDELNLAATLLRGKSMDQGRATEAAALALKSRLLLSAAGDFANSNGSWAGGYAHKELIGNVGGDRTARWQAAKDAAKAVIDLPGYSLYAPNPASAEEATKNYADIFLKQSTSEDIYYKFFTTKVDQNWDGYNPGLYNNPNGYHGWGSNTPLQQFVDAYEMKDGTKFSWSNPMNAAAPYINRDPRFYATVNYDGAKWRPRPADVVAQDPVGIIQTSNREKWNGTSISIVPGLDTRKSPFEDWNGTYTGYFLRKFVDPTVDAQFNKQTQPWRYIRYTEIVLNYVEACIGLGQETEAKTYLNKIRKRAFMPDVTESGSALVQRYRNERLIELAYEGQRFFDIRRWLIAAPSYTNALGIDILQKLNPDRVTYGTPVYTVKSVQDRAWNPRFYLFPISTDELSRNSKLFQNPLY
ncbi:MAG: RagB/SusD family nutrient uptake outer membrane protein [Aquabacterium sp.]|nr:RagB/SusD family nutrient uptake outer membrane protein [Ferruginibacter sp.]